MGKFHAFCHNNDLTGMLRHIPNSLHAQVVIVGKAPIGRIAVSPHEQLIYIKLRYMTCASF